MFKYLNMKEYSKTFCVYPWIQQQTTPTGKINFCCISMHTFVPKEDGKPMMLDKETFKDAWNSGYMRDIRKKMINGEAVKGCETCYEQEKVGKKSYRQGHNEEWSRKVGKKVLEERVEKSIGSDFQVDEPPMYLDLRLGNLCNLKCRMCNPYNSVQIQKEWEKLDAKSNNQYSKFWNKYGLEFGGCTPWYESENFWKGVEENIPYLEKVYMTGGEPTLIEGNYHFLNRCRELGYADKIELFFNINFTNLKDEFIEQLRDFKWTSVNASLDGYGIVNDYIRAPSRFSMIDKNFRKMAREGGTRLALGISPVIQIYNILNIVDLLEYSEEVGQEANREILVDFLFCLHPDFLDVIHLPDNIKQEALHRLEEYKQTSKAYKSRSKTSFFLTNGVDSLVTRLEKSLGKENPEMVNDFIKYTKTLDKERRQSFEETLPELHFLLEEAGYNFAETKAMTEASS